MRLQGALKAFSLFFILLIGVFFFFPSVSVEAASRETLLRPRIFQVTHQQVCPHPVVVPDSSCSIVFFIQGKNFTNSNPRGSVTVGGETAKILRWSDISIVASTSIAAENATPHVFVDTTLHPISFSSSDPVLDHLFKTSMQTALDSVRVTKDGYRYLVAGDNYTNPPRTYYRDSYWLSEMLLMVEPNIVRDQILLSARGVTKEGIVPSAMTIDASAHQLSLWKDHHDSGPYLIMMVYDYIRWTGDKKILDEMVNGRSLYITLQSILTYLASTDADTDTLPEKPAESLQDWLDTIPRGGEVLYDAILYDRALSNLSELAHLRGDKARFVSYLRLAGVVKRQINKQFWNAKKGYYYERCDKDGCVDRITNESSLAILYDIVEPQNRQTLFKNLTKILETRNNIFQPYGDWGVLNAFPLYSEEKPYTYQNGTDWPFLSGINAGARLLYQDAGWYYPLTRWWTYSQKKQFKTATLPEYVSPIDRGSSTSQAWSVSPAVSLIWYGLGILPDLNGSYTNKSPVWGKTEVKDVLIRGERKDFKFP